MRLPFPLMLGLGVVLAGCTGGSVPVSDDVNSWSFTDTDGVAHSANTTKGEPTLLFFMSTWCGTCQATAPRLAQLNEEYDDQQLQMFTLSHDPTEDERDLLEWKAKYGQPWPHGVDEGSAVAKTFGITKQSSIVILNKDGEESRRWIYAAPSLDQLRAAVNDAST